MRHVVKFTEIKDETDTHILQTLQFVEQNLRKIRVTDISVVYDRKEKRLGKSNFGFSG